MNAGIFRTIENHMLGLMKDSAHDKEHIYRVLYMALDIASHEVNVDMDVLIAACLLHDIGREEQYKNPNVCHAQAGSRLAHDFLMGIGWDSTMADHVRECILTHRYRNENLPDSLEAKILFDADKIDATGTLGIARTLIYQGQESEPLYSVDDTGHVLDGASDEPPSFFQEYKLKLEKLYGIFYTKRGRDVAASRRDAAVAFYNSLLAEARECYEAGKCILEEIL